jgi:hypothetical protein
MSVRRFKSVEQMKSPRWRNAGDPDLFRAIASLWNVGSRTGVRRFPPGVYRHRSIEELDAQVERWAQANFRAFHAKRR